MKKYIYVGGSALGVAAAWSLVTHLAAQTPSYTHYVSVSGVNTGTCSEQAPCNTWWITQLNATQLPPGSRVHIAAGDYSPGIALNFARNGTAERPITYIAEPGARYSGGRVKPATWTKTAGFTYIYETDWDHTSGGSPGGFLVGTVIQRSPTNWKPILVDDRVPPFTSSLGRPFTLTHPPPYKYQSSLAAVDAQSGSWFASGIAKKVYVHMYHDGPPVEADDLYVGYKDGGAIRISGDYNVFEGLRIEKTSGTSLLVHTSANGTVLRNTTVIGQVWLNGTNTVAEDLDISHHIKQGDLANGQCYDANPGFGVGECWNAHGEGQALIVGREDYTTSYGQIVRRAYVHRSWNGMHLSGRQTVEDSTFWGFPNHAATPTGVGWAIRRSTFRNGQDSLFASDNPLGAMVLEHNIFVNAVHLILRNAGNASSVVTPWSMRHNIFNTVTVDRWVYNAMTSDCNVFMSEGQNNMYIIAEGNNEPRAEYKTLAAIQANTPHEARSRSYPPSFWTAGRFFTQYTGQANPVADFSDPLTVCGERVGQ